MIGEKSSGNCEGPAGQKREVLGGNGDLSVYLFQLKGWSEGATLRKQEEAWDLMGSGVRGQGPVGKSFTKTMAKDLKQMGFPRKKEESNRQFLFGGLSAQ